MKNSFSTSNTINNHFNWNDKRLKAYQLLWLIVVASLFLAITGCSSKPNLENVNLKNAKQILDKNPNWILILKNARYKWGIPPSFVLSTIYQESRFKPEARNKHSSAYGYPQAINRTWEAYEQAIGKDADRSNFADSVDFIGWYFSDLKENLGLTWNDQSNLYMAYLLGEGGYKKYKSGDKKSKSSKNWPTDKKISEKVAKLSSIYKKQLSEVKSLN